MQKNLLLLLSSAALLVSCGGNNSSSQSTSTSSQSASTSSQSASSSQSSQASQSSSEGSKGSDSSHATGLSSSSEEPEVGYTCTVDNVRRELTEAGELEGFTYYQVGLRKDQVITIKHDGTPLNFYAFADGEEAESLGTSFTATHGGYWQFGINADDQVWVAAPQLSFATPENFAEDLALCASSVMTKTSYSLHEAGGIYGSFDMTVGSIGDYTFDQPTKYDSAVAVTEDVQADVSFDVDPLTGEVTYAADADATLTPFVSISAPSYQAEQDPETQEYHVTQVEGRTLTIDPDQPGSATAYLAGGNAYCDLTSFRSLYNEILTAVSATIPTLDVEEAMAQFPPDKFVTPTPEELNENIVSLPANLASILGMGSMLFTNNEETGVCNVPAVIGDLLTIEYDTTGRFWSVALIADSEDIINLLDAFVPAENDANGSLAMVKSVLALLNVNVALLFQFKTSGAAVASLLLDFTIPADNKPMVLALANSMLSTMNGPAWVLTDVNLNLHASVGVEFGDVGEITVPTDLESYIPFPEENQGGDEELK